MAPRALSSSGQTSAMLAERDVADIVPAVFRSGRGSVQGSEALAGETVDVPARLRTVAERIAAAVACRRPGAGIGRTRGGREDPSGGGGSGGDSGPVTAPSARTGCRRRRRSGRRSARPLPTPRCNLIGPLQSNKARDAVALFDTIETVDRPKLAGRSRPRDGSDGQTPRLSGRGHNTGRRTPRRQAFFRPGRISSSPPAATNTDCRWRGLMCVPPLDEEPALHFALLAEIARRNELRRLSMGMTADFETAIRFGAHPCAARHGGVRSPPDAGCASRSRSCRPGATRRARSASPPGRAPRSLRSASSRRVPHA